MRPKKWGDFVKTGVATKPQKQHGWWGESYAIFKCPYDCGGRAVFFFYACIIIISSKLRLAARAPSPCMTAFPSSSKWASSLPANIDQ